jgi:hypothetical protein
MRGQLAEEGEERQMGTAKSCKTNKQDAPGCSLMLRVEIRGAGIGFSDLPPFDVPISLFTGSIILVYISVLLCYFLVFRV